MATLVKKTAPKTSTKTASKKEKAMKKKTAPKTEVVTEVVVASEPKEEKVEKIYAPDTGKFKVTYVGFWQTESSLQFRIHNAYGKGIQAYFNTKKEKWNPLDLTEPKDRQENATKWVDGVLKNVGKCREGLYEILKAEVIAESELRAYIREPKDLEYFTKIDKSGNKRMFLAEEVKAAKIL